MGIIGNYKLAAIAISMAIAFVIFVFYFLYLPADRGNNEAVEVMIERGDGLQDIAGKLKNSDLIESEILFMAYVRLRGEDSQLKAGRYIFSKSLDIPAIVSLIVAGKSEPGDLEITIPEGLNVWEIDELLVKKELISEGQFSSRYYGEEGYLFPDTYRLRNFQFPRLAQARAERAVSNLQINSNDQNLKLEISEEDFIKELRGKMGENLNLRTTELLGKLEQKKRKEIIIVASILEKEAKTEEDMRLIAGIIYKRLEMEMPLQIDATVIYGACLRNFQFLISNFQQVENCNVTFQSPAEEIKIDGPYNTYTRKGLPLEPISNPGLKTIGAALNPTLSNYLYYLSTRDGSQMIYSKTPAEHARNRRKYLGI